MEPINHAFTQYGQKEIPGIKDNPEILKYYKAANVKGQASETIAWCAAFVNWCNVKACHETTGNLVARSFLKIGKEVQDPELGDIAIFWRIRQSHWAGHVGFFINRIGENIFILGGNQNNQVNIRAYPAIQLLGYRRTEPGSCFEEEARVCDLCANFITHPSDTKEACVKVRDNVIPEAYFEARRTGQEPDCSLKAPII